MTRLLFACDVHGSEKCFKKLLNAPRYHEGVDIIILGGDICGKFLVTIVEQGASRYSCRAFGQEWKLRGQADLDQLCKLLRDAGYYPHVCPPEERQRLDEDRAFCSELFSRLMRERVLAWLDMVAERVDDRIRVVINPGNDDEPGIEDLIEASARVVNPLGGVVELDDYHMMISMEWVNPTPWKSPRECPEDELSERIEQQVALLNGCDIGRVVFNFHAPPYDSGLDRAPKLTSRLTMETAGGSPVMVPVGSTAVRSAIERYQPLLGLHGHIHESRGFTRIGRSVCINPGSDYPEGVLSAAIVDLDRGKVASWFNIKG